VPDEYGRRPIPRRPGRRRAVADGGVDDVRRADDFDLELIESRTLDGNIQELIYRPARHA
jgi:hypothetical protein